jgi:hypothetical protein
MEASNAFAIKLHKFLLTKHVQYFILPFFIIKSLGNPQIDVLFFFFLQMKQIKNDVKLIKNFFNKINIFYKCSNEL